MNKKGIISMNHCVLFFKCVLCIFYVSGVVSLHVVCVYSGTSLLRSPTGLGKSDLNGEVTLLQGVICTVEYNLGLSQGDCNWEVFVLER